MADLSTYHDAYRAIKDARDGGVLEHVVRTDDGPLACMHIRGVDVEFTTRS